MGSLSVHERSGVTPPTELNWLCVVGCTLVSALCLPVPCLPVACLPVPCLPVAGQGPADDDFFVLQFDIAALDQFRHHFTDHLARCTNHIAEVLMRVALFQTSGIIGIRFGQFI